MEVNLKFQNDAKGDSQVTRWTDFSYNRAQRRIDPPRTTKGGKFQVATLSSNSISRTKVVTAWGLGELPLVEECASVLDPQTLQALIRKNQAFSSYHRYLELKGLSQRTTSANDYEAYKARIKDLPELCYQDSVGNTFPHREHFLNRNAQQLWSEAQQDLTPAAFINLLRTACSEWATDSPNDLAEWCHLQLEEWVHSNSLTADTLRELETTTLIIPQNGFQRHPHQPVKPYTYDSKRRKTRSEPEPAVTSPNIPAATQLTMTTDVIPTITPRRAVTTGMIINTASPSNHIIRQQAVVMVPAMQSNFPIPPYQHDVMQNLAEPQLRDQEEEGNEDLMNLLQDVPSDEGDWQF